MKQFILGIGCQKGASTWLHRQLNQNKHVNMGFQKEYHTFDRIHIDEGRLPPDKSLIHFCQSLIQNKQNIHDNINFLRLLFFRLDPNSYFSYFNDILTAEEISTTGDITPAYAALPAEVFRQIKQELAKRKIDVKVIFIMRDPVKRCWSQVRMRRSKKMLKQHPPTEEEELLSFYTHPICEVRTRYEKTIFNIEQVFSPSEIFYGIYETMFTVENLNKLSSFLNIKDFSLDAEEVIFPTEKKKSTISENATLLVKKHYKDTYDFCQQRFNIKDVWS